MSTPKTDKIRDELFGELRAILAPEDKKTSIQETAEGLKHLRKKCQDHNIDYNKLLGEVCTSLSSERKK